MGLAPDLVTALTIALRMAPTTRLGYVRPKVNGQFNLAEVPLGLDLLKPDEVSGIVNSLQTEEFNGDIAALVKTSFARAGFSPPQYRAAIHQASLELRLNQVLGEHTPPLELVAINCERVRRYGFTPDDLSNILAYTADLTDEQMTSAQKVNAINVYAWYAGVAYPVIRKNTESVLSGEMVKLDELLKDFKEALDKLRPHPDFDISRFGKKNETVKIHHLSAVIKAINEEILLPSRFTGSTYNFLVGESVGIHTPANRRITLFKKDSPFNVSDKSESITSSYYLRDSFFDQSVNEEGARDLDLSRKYNLERSTMLQENSSLSDYIKAMFAINRGLSLQKIEEAYRKADEDFFLSRSDIEQAAEAILGRRVYPTYAEDEKFQLAKFVKLSVNNNPGNLREMREECFKARSFLIAIKHSEFPLMVFNKYIINAFSLKGLALGKGTRLAADLLLVNMEEDGLQTALSKTNANGFAKILKSRIVGNDKIEDLRNVYMFNEILRDAASNVLDRFTYENLDEIPGIPKNWRDFKAEWKPAVA